MLATPVPVADCRDTNVDTGLAANVSCLANPESRASARQQALAELFSCYREPLLRMVEFRLHPQVRSRIDPWDVLQESFLDAAQRVEHLHSFRGSFFKWLRLVVLQRIAWLHRHHLTAQKRDALHEVSLEGGWTPDGDGRLAEQLAASLTSPSQAVQRAELIEVVNQVIAGLKPVDREVLLLRHFEHLGNAEAAEVLDITPVAASIRYARALARLTAAITRIAPGEIRSS